MSIIKPFDYQQRAFDDLMTWLYANAGQNPAIEAPTGSGKSVMIAMFCAEVLQRWPGQRVLMLCHVKELVEQNLERLLAVWPDAPVGVYSAGMGRKELDQPIVFASVQSLARAKRIPPFDVIVVDEAHRVPFYVDPESNKRPSQYEQVFTRLGRPLVVGLTATPYRMDGGPITRDDDTDTEDQPAYVFDAICHRVSVSELLEKGRISPIRAVGSSKSVDLAGVRIVRGEFDENQMANAFMAASEPILDEVVKRGRAADRHKWLLFCCNLEHVEQTIAGLRKRGVSCAAVTGNTPMTERANLVASFKRGEFQALVNCAVFTTGFDVPDVDLIALLRATQSTALYVQIVGRGMRVATGKTDCLLLDYGTNVRRHGQIDGIKARRKKKRGQFTDEPPMKDCPECLAIIAASLNPCPECGHEFGSDAEPVDPWGNLALNADDAEPMTAYCAPRKIQVKHVTYARHVKRDTGAQSLRVNYHCGLQTYSEWIAIGREGPAGVRAARWWNERAGCNACPKTVDQALAESNTLDSPSHITVSQDGRFFKVVSCDFQKNREAA